MSQVHTLLLRLEGPMQSWGYRSRFDYRDTALEPTRSGVIGLICAAMGIARDEYAKCKDKDGKPLFDCIRLGVRVDREGRPERDYHTALDVIKADASGKDTVQSWRDYLADASFTVGLESANVSLLNEIAHALQNPKWFLFLGRKAFPLAVPPVETANPIKVGSLEEVLLSGASGKRVVLEQADGERTQHDWPLCFGQRRFKPRSMHVQFDGKGDSE